MIVYDLRCDAGHDFEGWFADRKAFDAQSRSDQLLCPYCGETRVERRVSKLRIGSSTESNATSMTPASRTSPPSDERRTEVLGKLAALQTEMLKTSQWVGNGFARRARAMADGDEPTATIHGQATVAEAKAMRDEGVAVMPLLFPVIPPEQKH